MLPNLVIFVICVLLSCNVNGITDLDWKPIVSTTLGRVQGSVMSSRLGRPFYAFRGIRYGKPPVGALRFRAPVPAEPWSDVFDATQDGPRCVQYRANNDYSVVSEDCLRLNVYSHNVCRIKAIIVC